MKKWFSLILCLLLAITVFAGCGDATQTQSPSPDNSATISPTATPGSDDEKEQLMESLREEFLAKADEVVVDEDSVTFQDASAADTITIQKNPEETVNLYASFTTLWYEAGGTVVGCIGGSTSQEDVYKRQVLYHAEAEWSGGKYMPMDKVARHLTENQIDFDLVPIDSLKGAHIEHGKLLLNQEKYPCLIVPYSEKLPKDAIRIFWEFAQQGLCCLLYTSRCV